MNSYCILEELRQTEFYISIFVSTRAACLEKKHPTKSPVCHSKCNLINSKVLKFFPDFTDFLKTNTVLCVFTLVLSVLCTKCPCTLVMY